MINDKNCESHIKVTRQTQETQITPPTSKPYFETSLIGKKYITKQSLAMNNTTIQYDGLIIDEKGL